MEDFSDNVNNITTIVPPSKTLLIMYSARVGVILSNISIVCVLLCLSTLLLVVLSLVAFLLVIVLIFATFGLILLAVPEIGGLIGGSGELVQVMSTIMAYVWPIAGPIGIISAIASIVFLAMDKKNLNVPRIVVSSIVLGLIIIVFIALLVSTVN